MWPRFFMAHTVPLEPRPRLLSHSVWWSASVDASQSGLCDFVLWAWSDALAWP